MKWEAYPIFQQEAYAPLLPVLWELADQLALDTPEQEALARRTGEFPDAVLIFLQLLHHNERCLEQGQVEDALFAESLAYSTLQGGVGFKRWLASRPSPVSTVPAANTEPLLLQREGNRLSLRFNRPEARNAYSAVLRDALYEALQLLGADASITSCVIEGEGSCFCIGGDLSEFGQASDPAAAHAIRMARPVPLLLSRLSSRIECRVHRACIGSGIELPAFAGKVVATHDTFFQLPELAMGLIPGAGGTVSILKRIGRHRLAWWVLSGRKIRAETALEWGLVDALTD